MKEINNTKTIKGYLLRKEIEDMNMLNKQIETLILEGLRLQQAYDITCSCSCNLIDEFKTFSDISVTEFVNDSILLSNTLLEVTSYNVNTYNLDDINNDKRYEKAMKKCLENLFAFLPVVRKLISCIDSWEDSYISIKSAPLDIKELDIVLENIKKVVSAIKNSYWTELKWCETMISYYGKMKNTIDI